MQIIFHLAPPKSSKHRVIKFTEADVLVDYLHEHKNRLLTYIIKMIIVETGETAGEIPVKKYLELEKKNQL